ncbi:MAG: hypothetical protein AAGK98_12180 [Pseudomonadota bacterium]
MSSRLPLVFTSRTNSTCAYYIAPRLPEGFTEVLDGRLPEDHRGRDVVINRYATARLLSQLEQARPALGRIAYVLDDDLDAMVRSPAVPPFLKVNPARTLLRLRRLLRLVDRVFVATAPLSARIDHPDVRIIPPVADLPPPDSARQDPGHIAYFAKMHGPEHRFLHPVMAEVLRAVPGARATVIAEGSAHRRWAGMERVTAEPLMGFPDYLRFAVASDAGIALAPLLPSRLNAARSGAKRLEIVRAGAAGIFSDQPAYGDDPGELRLPNDPEVWRATLIDLTNDPARIVALAQASHTITARQWAERGTLFDP